ncbi:MAG: B12 binding domain / kinase domain / Methylmalonyl-CoA mutase, partial [uncultured Nocardioides sp.]
ARPAPAPAPHPPGHLRRALRRPRRVDQHHAADPPEPGLRGGPPRAQPVGAGGRGRGRRGGRPGRGGLVLPGRARRVLRVPRRVAAGGRRRARPRRRGRRGRHRAGRDRQAARVGRHDLLPRGRPEDGPGRDDQLRRRGLRRRPLGPATGRGRGGPVGRPVRRRPRDHRGRGRAAGPGRARGGPYGGRTPRRTRARHHRDRRLRQVLADRRDRAALPRRPAGQAADRRRRRRPHPPQGRRRAPRRPDPCELARRRPGVLPLARHPRRPRGPRAPARRRRRAQGRRLRPRRGRDARHRAGRRRHRPPGRPLALRHDAGVRRRVPAREDRHARLRRHGGDQQVRAPRRQGRAARRGPPAGPQPRGVRQAAARHAGLRHQRRDVQRRRGHGPLPAPPVGPRRDGPRRGRGRAAPGRRPALLRHPPGRAAGAGPLPLRDHRDRPGLPRPHRGAGRVGVQPPAGRARRRPARRARRRRGARPAREGAQGGPPRGARPDQRLAGRGRVLLRRRAGRAGPRPRDHHEADPRVAERHQDPPGLAAAVHRPRRAGAVLAPREPARLLPLHRGRLPVQARQRGPRPHVRRRGRPGADQPALQDPLRRQRRHPPVHGVRLRHALRPRPRPAPRRLRQGRDLGRLRRDARRHVGALRRLRPRRSDHLGLADDQRPGPHRPGVLPQHRDRPAGRRVRRARGPGAGRRRASPARGVRAGERPRHGPGRHPQGGPGPEHRAVLHRVLAADDGRHPGVVHPAAGPQLLLGVDLRLPHRRGRGEPHQPAGVHPRQRVHLRRGLPRAGHGHRRLRAQPVLLLLQRHGPRVLRHRPRRPPHLGGHHEGEVRRERAVAEAEVPRPDERSVPARSGDGLQRHPHHAPGAHRDLRQRQQPPHQRVRRGRDHADGGVGAPGAGDPADHQPGVGARDEREPAPGLVRDRRADRPRRGGGAPGVRQHQRARRRAGRDGDRLPARPHPGRVDAVRAPQARRHAADHRRQHLRQGVRRGRAAPGDRARPRHGGREGVAAAPRAGVPGGPRRRGPGGALAAQGRRHLGRERVRRADGRRPGLLAPAGHGGVLRGGRAVPPQRL